MVTREQIIERLWGADVHLDTEHNINTAIRKVRYALRDDSGRQRYIQTVVGKGYKFVSTAVYGGNGAEPAETKSVSAEPVIPVAEINDSEVEDSDSRSSPDFARPAITAKAEIKSESHKPKYSIAFWSTLAVAAAGLLGAAIAIFLPQNQQRRTPVANGVHSIAILPFQNLTGDPQKDFIADSLTREITSNLAQFHSLRVISPSSVPQVRNTRAQLAQLRRELKVDALIQGSQWNAGGHLRIAMELLDTRSRRHLWAKHYDLFDPDALRSVVLDDATRQLSNTLGIRNPSDTKPSHTPNAQAYNDYLRGRYFWNKRTLDGLEKSIDYYQQALKADPQYAQVYAALADSYVISSSYGGPEPAQSLALARQNALRALQLDPKLGEAHAVLGAVKVDNDSNWEGAEEEYRMALRLNPEYPTARHWYALHLSRLGRHAEAEAQIRQALELDPLSLIINTDAGEIFYRGADLDSAFQYVHKALELEPDFAAAHLVLGLVYERKHQFAEALSEFRTAEKLFHNAPNAVALEGHALALSGDKQGALQIAEKLKAIAAHRYVSGVDIAIVYCALGDSNQAMAWLDKAYKRQDKGLNILAADPLFAPCRADPRFSNLLSKMRLPELQLP